MHADGRGKWREAPRPDGVAAGVDGSFFRRWRAALWFWSSVAFTAALGAWWWYESLASWR